MASVSSSWTVAWLLTLTPLGEGGKLLVVLQDGGQWPSLSPLVRELGQRAHQIVLLVPDTSFITGPTHAYNVKTYSVPYTKEYWEAKVKSISHSILKEDSFLEQIRALYQRIVNMTEMMLSACRHLVDDVELLQSLQEDQFDALLMDPMFPCGQIVAEYLSTPSVFFTRAFPCGFNHEAALCPGPSFTSPRLFKGHAHHMEFTQRLKYMLVALPEWRLCQELYSSYELLASRRLEKEVTYQELISSTSLWLLRADFINELPRLATPNIVFIGGITCAGKKPLSQEFEKLVNDSGEHGIVVFSLGSMVSEIPMQKAMAIAEALGTVPQTVLWRYTGQAPPNLAANTKLIKWLPQNDLLAHPKARAFITHAGSHGIYEGICNAVPMVLLPLFGDQMDNAKRIESRGAGVTLNVLQMTAQDLSNALKTVINDPSYKENISRLSALHLDRPIHPLDLAVHWVEFVMRHKGAPHLRPAAHDLNWIQYHSLDVIAFLLAVVSVTLFIVIKCCCFCGRKCCGQKRRPQKSKTH